MATNKDEKWLLEKVFKGMNDDFLTHFLEI
jgi:hypothetical protein